MKVLREHKSAIVTVLEVGQTFHFKKTAVPSRVYF